jgi:4-hydroxy-2-oxoheptanedioate aldolase
MANKIKAALEAGEVVVGPFIISSAPILVELAGYVGFDFVMIDMEHTSTDFIIAEQMVLAAKASNITPGIRVPENRPTHILRALEIGAEIIDVPLVSTRDEAASVVRSGKYFPLGERGCAPITRGNLYGSYGALGGVAETLRRANEETMLMVQIETREGVENVDEIASTDYIDIVFIGPADLSQSLGIPGQYDNPIFEKAVKKVIRTIRDKGKFAGIFVIGGAEVGRKWVDEGAQLLTPFADSYQIYLCWKDVVESYESTIKAKTSPVKPEVWRLQPQESTEKRGNPNNDWFDVI